MPRIYKKLPANRSEWSFGELVYWHLFEFGTRPNIDPSAIAGRKWEPEAICGLLDITWKTLRNWIADKHFPDSTVDLERELFGNNPDWDIGRRELAEALRKTRARKANESARSQPNKSTPIPVRPEEAQAPAKGEPNKSDEAGKVRKSETRKQEIPEKSTGASSDPQGQNGDLPGPENTSNFRKSAHESSGEPEDFPEDDPASDQHNASQSHEDEPAGSSAQPGQEERKQEEASGGSVPDLYASPYRYKVKPRRLAALLATGAVVVFGLYAVTLTNWFDKPATTSTLDTQAKPKLPDAQPKPGPDGSGTPPRPDKEGKPQFGPQDGFQAPPKPADPPPRPRTQEEKQAEEERRILQKTIEAMKAAHDREVREREEEARRLDREGAAGAATRAQRDREWNARQAAGMGYELLEYTGVNGAPIGRDRTETVYDCALSCLADKCDAFAWFRDERPSGPRTCFRFRAPVDFYDNPGYTAGKKRSQLVPDGKLAAAGGTAQAAPLIAQAGPVPESPALDGVTHCPNGPVKVTGFELTCDARLEGGTTLGSNRLSWTVTNINECARKCQPIKNCVGFTFNAAQRDGHSCVLFGPTPVKRDDVPGWISGERPVR